MRGRPAFSLPEMMIICALLSLILAIYAGLVQRYSTISRFLARKDTTMQAALVGLERVRSEVAQAVAVIDPPATVTVPAAELRFQRVDPTVENRLPDFPEDPVPSTIWRPHQVAHLITVHHFKQGDDLMREALLPGGSSVVQSLARDVDGFSTLNLPDGNLRLTLSVKEENRVRTLSTELMLNTPPAVVP